MQNRYVGDVGDFGKYGLLRWLCGKPELPDNDPDSPTGKLRLGIVWHLHPDEENGGGGIDTPPNLRKYDCHLYDQLQKIRRTNVVRVKQSLVLHCPTEAYWEKTLCFSRQMKRPERETLRKEWLDGALRTTDGSDIVFVDPDNGIACECSSPFIKTGPKYAYLDDLNRFTERGQSLVIYHHLTRRHGEAIEEIQHFANRLKTELRHADLSIAALWHHPKVARFYFVVGQRQHQDTIKNRLERCPEASLWCKGTKPPFTYFSNPETIPGAECAS